MIKKFELLAKKSFVRTLLQEFVEVKVLRENVALKKNKIVLEIGCGTGVGTRLIKKYFYPAKTHGLDIDPAVIENAKKKTKDTDIVFEVGDAAKLPYKDKTYDAVFDFGVLYHIENWQACLKEIKRVLKPGGQLIIEELSLEALDHSLVKFLRKVFERPYKTMYKRDDFFAYMQEAGWHITTKKILHPLGLEYFIIIAAKPTRS